MSLLRQIEGESQVDFALIARILIVKIKNTNFRTRFFIFTDNYALKMGHLNLTCGKGKICSCLGAMESKHQVL